VKAIKVIALLALMILAGSVARADGIDPTVVIRQVDPTPIHITDPNETFTFTATSAVTDAAFENDTKVVLQSLSLVLTGNDGHGNPLSFSFGSNPGDGIFANFTSTVVGFTTTLLFSGVDATHTGLLPFSCPIELEELETQCGPVYDIQFTGIPIDGTVSGTATVSPTVGTPEPATFILFTAGLAGLAALRKRHTALQN